MEDETIFYIFLSVNPGLVGFLRRLEFSLLV